MREKKTMNTMRYALVVLALLAMIVACFGMASCDKMQREEGDPADNEFVGTYWIAGENTHLGGSLAPDEPSMYISMNVNPDGTVRVVNHSPNTESPFVLDGTWDQRGFNGGITLKSESGKTNFGVNTTGYCVMNNPTSFFGSEWKDVAELSSMSFKMCDDDAANADFLFERIPLGSFVQYEIRGKIDENGSYVDETGDRGSVFEPKTVRLSMNSEGEVRLKVMDGGRHLDGEGRWWGAGGDTVNLWAEWDKDRYPMNVHFLDDGTVELRSVDNFQGWGEFENSQCLIMEIDTDPHIG